MVGNSAFFFFPLQGPFYWIAGIVQVIHRLDWYAERTIGPRRVDRSSLDPYAERPGKFRRWRIIGSFALPVGFSFPWVFRSRSSISWVSSRSAHHSASIFGIMVSCWVSISRLGSFAWGYCFLAIQNFGVSATTLHGASRRNHILSLETLTRRYCPPCSSHPLESLSERLETLSCFAWIIWYVFVSPVLLTREWVSSSGKTSSSKVEIHGRSACNTVKQGKRGLVSYRTIGTLVIF